jgi:hypothetical protein
MMSEIPRARLEDSAGECSSMFDSEILRFLIPPENKKRDEIFYSVYL